MKNLKEGSALFTNFTIANPAGYKEKNAIEVTSFRADVDYKNRLIEQIEIIKPVINAEQKGQKNNFQDLLENMPASEDDETSEEESDTVITINQLALRSATINLITSDLAIGAKTLDLGDQSFVMDDFVMTNVSGTATEISDEVVQRLTSHVSSQVSSYVKNEIGKIAKEKLIEEAKEKISEKVNDVVKDKLDGKLDGEIGEKLKGLKFKFGKD